MYAIAIEVPDMNDSVSKVTLLGTQYQIRFTYNDTEGYWYFGLYDSLGNPIRIGEKIVPQFPLNLFWGAENTPLGVFGALSEQDSIGRKDFIEGRAKFIFIPA